MKCYIVIFLYLPKISKIFLNSFIDHSSFINSSGMNKSGFCNFLCAPISPKKNFLRHKYQGSFLFYRFNQSVQSPTRHLESEYTDWLNL